MGSSLIFAFCVAALALLVFGERLGLPANIAAFGVTGILAFLVLGLSLASSTSRLKTFLHTRDSRTFWDGTCSGAMILMLILHFSVPAASIPVSGLLAFLGGLFVVLVLAPPLLAEGGRGQPDADRMIAILTALAALYFAIQLWPFVLREVSAAADWQPGTAGIIILAIAGLPAILGGLDGLARLSGRILALFIALCLLPFAIECLRQLSPGSSLSGFTGMAREIATQSLPEVSRLGSILLNQNISPDLMMTGALAGLALRMTNAALPLRSQRFFAPLLGLCIAGAFLIAAWLTKTHLDAVILPGLARLSPVDWPLFAFDPALQGWLSVCGKAPRDAVDIAQACGTSTSPALAKLVLDRQLAFPAVAASAGWPLLLGTVWSLAIPLFLAIALGLLIHAAASGISENILFGLLRPHALRASRLAMARSTAFAIMGWLFFAPALDAQLAQTLGLGMIILLAVSIASNWLRQLVAALRRLSRARLVPSTP